MTQRRASGRLPSLNKLNGGDIYHHTEMSWPSPSKVRDSEFEFTASCRRIHRSSSLILYYSPFTILVFLLFILTAPPPVAAYVKEGPLQKRVQLERKLPVGSLSIRQQVPGAIYVPKDVGRAYSDVAGLDVREFISGNTLEIIFPFSRHGIGIAQEDVGVSTELIMRNPRERVLREDLHSFRPMDIRLRLETWAGVPRERDIDPLRRILPSGPFPYAPHKIEIKPSTYARIRKIRSRSPLNKDLLSGAFPFTVRKAVRQIEGTPVFSKGHLKERLKGVLLEVKLPFSQTQLIVRTPDGKRGSKRGEEETRIRTLSGIVGVTEGRGARNNLIELRFISAGGNQLDSQASIVMRGQKELLLPPDKDLSERAELVMKSGDYVVFSTAPDGIAEEFEFTKKGEDENPKSDDAAKTPENIAIDDKETREITKKSILLTAENPPTDGISSEVIEVRKGSIPKGQVVTEGEFTAEINPVEDPQSYEQVLLETRFRIPEIHQGNPRSKLVALTFDDGPHPKYTPQIISLLSAHKVPATFFVVGKQAERFPHLVAQESQLGFEIGNHTYEHFRLNLVRGDELIEQILKTQEIVRNITGKEPRLIRPPGGLLDDKAFETISQSGLTVVLWSYNSNDINKRDPKAILKSVLENTRGGSILLFHDGVQGTIEALPEIIKALQKEGYRFVTVSELIANQ